MEYSFGRTFNESVADLRPRVETALKEQGFGILTEIDVQATLKKKINVDRKPYLILGACNPPLANRAINTEAEVGLFLPCNVILYETEDGSTRVSFFDPAVGMDMADNPDLEPIGNEAKQKLKIALNNI